MHHMELRQLRYFLAVAEDYDGNDPIWHLSDKYGMKIGARTLEEAILSLLPEGVRKGYRAAKHFAITDISRT